MLYYAARFFGMVGSLSHCLINVHFMKRPAKGKLCSAVEIQSEDAVRRCDGFNEQRRVTTYKLY